MDLIYISMTLTQTPNTNEHHINDSYWHVFVRYAMGIRILQINMINLTRIILSLPHILFLFNLQLAKKLIMLMILHIIGINTNYLYISTLNCKTPQVKYSIPRGILICFIFVELDRQCIPNAYLPWLWPISCISCSYPPFTQHIISS